VLPTFERESAQTLGRLERFAIDTDPLVTQLRPAARELSPTLEELRDIAPDLRDLFAELGPLITASRTGFPAAQKVIDDLRPLLAQADPALRELNPILDFIGLYKRELTAFFANSAAATQATPPGSQTHYLRTTNPLNPENLAVYPRRLGTNRSNPYVLPNGFDKLKQGLDTFENRNCGQDVMSPSQVVEGPGSVMPKELLALVKRFAFPADQSQAGAAPPCRLQSKFNTSGEQTQYPHVRVQP